MKKNKDTYIDGRKVVLVPYERSHVPKYHEWMQNDQLQQLTASEPLTMEEEYEMQESWRDDDKKCTFIVLDAEKYSATKDEIESMVGDVNLFFNDDDDPTSAEVEIMIAEAVGRGKGLGKEALLAMMYYGLVTLEVTRYTAKIGMSNATSLSLFAKVGFKEVARSEVFQEVTLELAMVDSVVNWLKQQNQHLHIEERESQPS